MLRKYSVLIGLVISLLLLIIATRIYPGGSLADKNSIGFDWSTNFFCNLFDSKAMNGADNPSRIWADTGMGFLSATFASFFIGFSGRIPNKGAARVIKFGGLAGMICTMLIVTPWHDQMVMLSGTLFLLCLFYITVFVLKSQLHVLKVGCVLCLLMFYYTFYLYGTSNLVLLPIMQKLAFLFAVMLILVLEYFTTKQDFDLQPKKEITTKSIGS